MERAAAQHGESGSVAAFRTTLRCALLAHDHANAAASYGSAAMLYRMDRAGSDGAMLARTPEAPMRNPRRTPSLACLGLLLAMATATALAHEPSTPDPPAASTASVGLVNFANSGAKAAQADFQHGVAQLHNFQYDDAAEAFRRAQMADPSFALAYWGEALTYTHPIWMQQDADAARAVLARLGPDRTTRLAKAKTEREHAYLDAVEILYGEGTKRERDRRYAAAMRRLHERWPDDVDGTAFYALALLGTAHEGRDVPTYMRAYALVKDLFPKYPKHPGVAHYLIHAVDDAAHAPLGLEAARAYAGIAPESSHAQHMTSHIFLALGEWNDVVTANERALQVASKRLEKRGAKLAGCGHSQTWLNYGYLQQGQYADSKRTIVRCLAQVRENPQLSERDQFDPDGSSLGSFYAMRLRHLLDAPPDAEVENWRPDAAAVPYAALLATYGDALVAARRGSLEALRASAAQMSDAADRLRTTMDRLDVPAASPYRRVLAVQLGQVDALQSILGGDRAGGLAKLEAVARDEDALPAAFGPPQVDQPTRELLGALIVDADPARARAQFERALVLNPGRVDARRGLERATRAAGDAAEADAIAASLRETLAHGDANFRPKVTAAATNRG
jgi:tetratricopeptide (TPR) repeat protein